MFGEDEGVFCILYLPGYKTGHGPGEDNLGACALRKTQCKSVCVHWVSGFLNCVFVFGGRTSSVRCSAAPAPPPLPPPPPSGMQELLSFGEQTHSTQTQVSSVCVFCSGFGFGGWGTSIHFRYRGFSRDSGGGGGAAAYDVTHRRATPRAGSF